MKTIWLIVFHILSSLVLVAKTGTITNIEVSQRTDGTGLVDIYFELSGNGISYDINLEVSFDGGTDFNPISASHLNGDLNSVSPGTNKHVIWDGAASYPETFAGKVIVKIIAIENSSGGPGETGTFTDPRDSRTYKTVKISNQTWMAEKLAFLPSVSPSTQESYTTPYYYVYDY